MSGLESDELAASPIEQFRRWLTDAVESGLHAANAMTLACADRAGRPSARIVLLKTFDDAGFVFSTNYESRKAVELDENPWASLVFHWPTLERQVRVEGRIARTTAAESDALFDSRPRGARLGSCASDQSRVIDGREALERKLRELDRKYTEAVPRPDHWGGYRLTPDRVEFWHGRSHRLHDRLRYTQGAGGGWEIQRLAP